MIKRNSSSPETEAKPAPEPQVQINIKVPKRGFIRRAAGLAINTQWRRWSALAEIKIFWGFVIKFFTDLIFPGHDRPKHIETFEQAIARLNLSEDDIKERAKKALLATYLYSLITVALIVHAIYLIYATDLIIAPLVTFILAVMTLTFAFREHFWYTQIKQRHLGLTLKNWTGSIFTKKSSPKQSTTDN